MEVELRGARTAGHVSRVIERHEALLAHAVGSSDPFLWCDEDIELLTGVLRARGIPHEVVLGRSAEGSSHLWVRVRGRVLDPTRQGCRVPMDVVERYGYAGVGRRSRTRHF